MHTISHTGEWICDKSQDVKLPVNYQVSWGAGVLVYQSRLTPIMYEIARVPTALATVPVKILSEATPVM